MAYIEVEMPDGEIETIDADTVRNLKRKISEIIGTVEDDIGITDDEGNVVPNSQTPPETALVVPKPRWGGTLDELALAEDMLEALEDDEYNDLFSIKLFEPNVFNPFRLYLYDDGEEWPVKVKLHSYPIETNPTVTFDQRIPPCPEHGGSWHPNIYDSGKVCWGSASVLPGTTITGLVNTLLALLHNPYHPAKIPGRC